MEMENILIPKVHEMFDCEGQFEKNVNHLRELKSD